ncbi:hypothetical protein [Beggiatoa leptomitoformis]|uniref:Uncharacterized protein n=1 Tax=Beggiatoa leptomitoformis TaxID=288004 RepID=A0A2N9YBD1_9GAMM|nr:hypothetical protein [Beggiatoa leptomitoformis]ALG66870.1 hypothetical protein AL038_02990 [Beggiatoa leptomitoformis]AUI67775.1 hypothetical protein BLE401_03050 [Beggiatoa leptomitoformis]
MKLLQTTAVLLFLLIIGYISANEYAPAVTAELRTYVKNTATEWSDEAKRSDPVGYLRFSQEKLEQQKVQLQTVVKEMRAAVQPLAEYIQQTREELAKTAALLNEGKTIYQQATIVGPSEVVSGIKFYGRTYPDVNSFKTQLEVLMQEKMGKESVLAKADTTHKQLTERLISTRLQIHQVEMAINQIAPQIAIVQAATAGNELSKLIGEAEKVTNIALDGFQEPADSYNLIRTTKELVEDAGQHSTIGAVGSVSIELENFLQSGK